MLCSRNHARCITASHAGDAARGCTRDMTGPEMPSFGDQGVNTHQRADFRLQLPKSERMITIDVMITNPGAPTYHVLQPESVIFMFHHISFSNNNIHFILLHYKFVFLRYIKSVVGKFGTFFVPNLFTYKYTVYCAYYALKHTQQRIIR